MKNNKIISMDNDFGGWYDSVIKEAKLACYGQVKGTIYFLPNGWAIWQNIQKFIDKKFAEFGSKNIQLPTFIKQSEFQKESKHVESFAPEAFVVTSNNKTDLSEPFIVRPTSEIIFCDCFKKFLNSYNDLPILFNQWCNVFRVEKNTRPFLRTSEFHWQELHTIHASAEEALKQTKRSLQVYQQLIKDELCMPFITGEKTENERFGGAENTFTVECLMQDGQALQCATSHFLGQNFAKAYDLKYQDKSNNFSYPQQTSAGLSTRIIGGLIMTHSDNNGLVLPFNIAPIQFGIICVNDKIKGIKPFVKKITSFLEKNNYRFSIDGSTKSFGWKVNNYQVQGVPFVFVVGQNELDKKSVTIIRRDITDKFSIEISKLKSWIKISIVNFNKNLYNKAKLMLDSSIVEVRSIDELKQALKNKKIALCYFKQSIENEKKIKQLTGATARCIKETLRFDDQNKCFFSNEKATHLVYFARAY